MFQDRLSAQESFRRRRVDWLRCNRELCTGLDDKPPRDGQMVFFVSNFAANGRGCQEKAQFIYLEMNFFDLLIDQDPTMKFDSKLWLCEKGWASQLNDTTTKTIESWC